MGDRALVRETRGEDLSTRNAAARTLRERIAALELSQVEDVIVGAASILVVLEPGAEPPAELLSVLEEGASPPMASSRKPRMHEVEVTYGGAAGPDLAEVARLHGTTEREVVSRHASARYTVGFLGFMPGFAYLIGLPAELTTPRLSTPRTRVAAGSVAIGGEFTGIYPQATPGGWRIIGRADVALFDVNLDPPARLVPGDLVKLVPR